MKVTSSELGIAGAMGGGKPTVMPASWGTDGAWPGSCRRNVSTTLKLSKSASPVAGPASPPRTDIPSVLVLRDDGIFASKERFRSQQPDPAHCDPAHAGAPAFCDIFLLSPSGDRYLRPRAFRERYPEAFVSRLEAEGLPSAILDCPAPPSGPAVIVRTSAHVFVPADAFADRRVPSAFTSESIFVRVGEADAAFVCLAVLERGHPPAAARLSPLQLDLIGCERASRLDVDRSSAARREFEAPASADREQFQEKWEPVFRPELRENKEIERFRDSGKGGTALEQFPEKWEPVFRPELRENNKIERFRDSGKSGTALDACIGDEDGQH